MSSCTSLHTAASLEGGAAAMADQMVTGNDFDIDQQIKATSFRGICSKQGTCAMSVVFSLFLMRCLGCSCCSSTDSKGTCG